MERVFLGRRKMSYSPTVKTRTMEKLIQDIGMVAGVALPFWNIPLILRIRRRKTSRDISLAWTFGVWACLLIMLPSTLLSSDRVLRAFGISNFVLFSFVVVTVLAYRKGPDCPER